MISLYLPSDFSSKISIILDNISSQVADKVGFWPMDELIHHPWQ
jgi:hypothetical protein